MNKLELLIRENRKKREFENYKNHFEKVLNISLKENDFLTLEQTDYLTNKFYESFKNSKKKLCEKYSLSDVKMLKAFVEKLTLKFNNKVGYLITKQTEICGLVKVSIDNTLLKYKEVIELDGDSLCILTIDESEGVYFDYFEENNNGVLLWCYDICVWTL